MYDRFIPKHPVYVCVCARTNVTLTLESITAQDFPVSGFCKYALCIATFRTQNARLRQVKECTDIKMHRNCDG
jgi:hypothetical protein